MKELHLTLTNSEYNELLNAVNIHNDITNDLTAEIESVYSTNINHIITKEMYIKIENEIKSKSEKLASIRTLMLKLNLNIDDNGYSIQ